ncbi:hypothetical protein PsYK624_171890 [Phanerochaete sordida]|uniref:Uncharacterized protein n=1 Tax=Phanerochaete sordida TaxID=48140 RepID=A0A9P3LN10_9APHY|nr:hypothetical protein PsYK624_171890 [Phanerochaete sordida]
MGRAALNTPPSSPPRRGRTRVAHVPRGSRRIPGPSWAVRVPPPRLPTSTADSGVPQPGLSSWTVCAASHSVRESRRGHASASGAERNPSRDSGFPRAGSRGEAQTGGAIRLGIWASRGRGGVRARRARGVRRRREAPQIRLEIWASRERGRWAVGASRLEIRACRGRGADCRRACVRRAGGDWHRQEAPRI